MTLADERNMVDASGWYIFSTDISGNQWVDFQNSWGITFADIESVIYSVSSSSPVDISVNVIEVSTSIPNPDIFAGGHIDINVPTPVYSILNETWQAYDISTNPTIEPFAPYWVQVLKPNYGMTRINQTDANNNIITKYIDAQGILGYNSYVNTVDIENIVSVTLGDLVDTISYSAFANSPTLEIVNISKSVTLIQANAFQDCIGLTTVVFQEDSAISAIDNTVFDGCVNLTEVYMTQGLLDKLIQSDEILVFGTPVNFRGAPNVTIKKLSELTKYTV